MATSFSLNSMEPDFSKLFHQSAKMNRKGGTMPIPADSSLWPEEWKTTYYKDYPRAEKLFLPAAEKPDANLFDTLAQRVSSKDFSGESLTSQELSNLLKFSVGTTTFMPEGRARRSFPSAGMRYPIETYLLVFSGSPDVSQGVYHYDVQNHALDVLERRAFSKEVISGLFKDVWAQRVACFVVFTSIFWRNQNKYGERGYRYLLVETGHMGQNICLVSSALGLKARPGGSTDDPSVEKLLEIDGFDESLIYTIGVGK